MRNALIHFDDWEMGQGRRPQKAALAAGSEPRDLARHYSGLDYHLDERVVRHGPFKIDVSQAVLAALSLARAIDAAAQEIDRQRDISQPSQ